MTNKKTRYCTYHVDCDREEDCFNGESCPFFETDSSCRTIRKTEKLKNCIEIMDDIWKGKQKEE